MDVRRRKSVLLGHLTVVGSPEYRKSELFCRAAAMRWWIDDYETFELNVARILFPKDDEDSEKTYTAEDLKGLIVWIASESGRTNAMVRAAGFDRRFSKSPGEIPVVDTLSTDEEVASEPWVPGKWPVEEDNLFRAVCSGDVEGLETILSAITEESADSTTTEGGGKAGCGGAASVRESLFEGDDSGDTSRVPEKEPFPVRAICLCSLAFLQFTGDDKEYMKIRHLFLSVLEKKVGGIYKLETVKLVCQAITVLCTMGPLVPKDDGNLACKVLEKCFNISTINSARSHKSAVLDSLHRIVRHVRGSDDATFPFKKLWRTLDALKIDEDDLCRKIRDIDLEMY